MFVSNQGENITTIIDSSSQVRNADLNIFLSIV